MAHCIHGVKGQHINGEGAGVGAILRTAAVKGGKWMDGYVTPPPITG